MSRSRDTSNIRRREQPSPLISHKGQDSTEGEAVCNYDTNVTTLYELLESSNWEKAKSRCRSHPHEVKTWIVRRDTISQKVRWKLLPLHAAVIFQSPTFVVSALIDSYPAAVSRRDDQGMLPLHLAFRYKEDNEDLLELLLSQYPKGVLMKDKRDRLPLEHGRGSKFSAKLLRLYADANVSGAKDLGIISDHDHRFGNQDAGRVSEVIADYEKKTRTLKSMYEDRIKMLQDQNKAALNQVRITSDEEKRKLVNVHVEEMEAMREMINTSGGADGAVYSDLEGEINQLRTALMSAKAERDSSNVHAADMKAHADEMALQMRQVLRDHETLQLMVSQQQLELDKAHTRREQLIQNLLRQEQDEKPTRVRRGSEIKQLLESGKERMDVMLQRDMSRLTTTGVGTSTHLAHHTHTHSPLHNHSLTHTPTTHHTAHHSPLNHTPRPRVPISSADKGSHPPLPQNTYYTGSPVVKDDISAITENSNF